jgi:hypothetical protein
LPATEGIQRTIPNLVEDRQGLLAVIALAQLLQPCGEPFAQVTPLLAPSNALTDPLELLGQLLERCRLRHQQGNTELLELLVLRPTDAVGPKQHQGRLQGEQTFHFQLPDPTHRGALQPASLVARHHRAHPPANRRRPVPT